MMVNTNDHLIYVAYCMVVKTTNHLKENNLSFFVLWLANATTTILLVNILIYLCKNSCVFPNTSVTCRSIVCPLSSIHMFIIAVLSIENGIFILNLFGTCINKYIFHSYQFVTLRNNQRQQIGISWWLIIHTTM